MTPEEASRRSSRTEIIRLVLSSLHVRESDPEAEAIAQRAAAWAMEGAGDDITVQLVEPDDPWVRQGFELLRRYGARQAPARKALQKRQRRRR